MSDKNTQQIQQRRVFTRIPFDADYRLQDPNAEHYWKGRVVDLSLRGTLVERPQNLQPEVGQEFIVELLLGADALKVVMVVKVAHFDEKNIGFHCMHIDLESITHLRKILEFNLGKPEMVEREITEMLNIATG
jgi:c-di-GMP-binding flagellar brake protein YcgR